MPPRWKLQAAVAEVVLLACLAVSTADLGLRCQPPSWVALCWMLRRPHKDAHRGCPCGQIVASSANQGCTIEDHLPLRRPTQRCVGCSGCILPARALDVVAGRPLASATMWLDVAASLGLRRSWEPWLLRTFSREAFA